MKPIQNLFQRIVLNSLSIALLIGIAIPSALADADLPKSKDHPLLPKTASWVLVQKLRKR